MGRLLSALFAVVILVSFVSNDTTAASLAWTLTVDPSEVQFVEPQTGLVGVAVDGYGQMNYVGYPALPYRLVNVLLPQGEEVSSFSLEQVREIELDASIPLVPFAGEYRDDGERLGLKAERSSVVGQTAVYPKWRVRHLGTNFYRGYRIATFAIYPFRYNIDTARLVLETEVRLVVETEPAPVFTERIERMRYVPNFRAESRDAVTSMVINSEMASSYIFNEIVVDTGNRPFLPSYLPSMEGSEVAYLIVTNEEMAPAFEVLADWKTHKGVPAVVRTIEWIAQNYRSGADLAESVRIFIQEAYAKWGVEWVLLAGDSDVIPARYGYVTFYQGEFIPTDMYYSCLDGSWNDDADSLWGEAYHSASDPGDAADLYSETYVGRMTASTLTEAQLLVDKVISYSTPIDTASKEKFLFLAEVIFPSDYDPGDEIILDGAEITEDIYNLYLISNPDVVVSRLYETCALYPGTICLTKATSLDSLDSGSNHVVHAGHGYKYNMSVGDNSILNYDASNLTNGDALYHMYLMNCTNVAFDTDCLAEYFLLNADGGAFAITGASRSAFPSASRPYMDFYYNLLFDQDMVKLGKLYTKSREPYTPAAFGETADRWTHFIYNYLGDPEVNIFQGRALTFDVTIPDSIGLGSNDITVQVQSDGSPYDSAFVCLYKQDDDYVYGPTDITGEITLTMVPKSEGYILVTVTGRNHCRYMDSIRVTQEAGIYMRFADLFINDGIVGNSDNVLDAGESVALFPLIENTGLTDAEKLYAILKTDESSVTITDSTATFPDVSSGDQEWALTGFVFDVADDVPDEQAVEFTIDIHDSVGGLWKEQFAIEVHSPQLEFYVNVVSDEPPYGDGDGIIQNAEDFLLLVGIKNFGTGTAYGLEGTISSTDIDVNITDSISVYDDIPLINVGYGDGFVLNEADRSEVNYITFNLEDAHGRTFTKEIELRRPDPPNSVVLDASHGPTEILVTWHRPDMDERYRYLIHHSVDQGGPYEQANVDLVNHTLFQDTGLDPSTRYYYVIYSVDSCGNVSDPSIEATITTSPPQQAGWPNYVGKETASSPKVADIDGDRHPEIVIGSDYVYAWHADGIEVRDGDNQPITWGVLNTDGDNYTATVALGDLDGNLGAEIVAASWNTREIYVFDHDGNTLPGWPQTTIDLCWASPVLGDIDDDGDLEVIAHDVDGYIYAWHHNGTEVRDGDSNGSTNGVFYVTHGVGGAPWHVSTPALADMDDDGIVEIIVATPDDANGVLEDSIYCLNSDGSAVPGWPVLIVDEGGSFSASPAVGDIDDDGFPEVVAQNSAGWVHCWNHDGTEATGWPRWMYSNKFFVGSPALADLNGNGKLEIVIPEMRGNLYIYRYQGGSFSGWPKQYDPDQGYTESSPTIADIDNDGSLDIIIGCEQGRLSAWNVSGEYIAGFPIFLNSFIRGVPMVKDIDYDGDIELIGTAWDKNVYVWDIPADRHHNYIAWNGFHGDLYNSGWTEIVTNTAVDGLTCVYRLIHNAIELSWTVPPEEPAWNLYRRWGDEEYELIHRGLTSGADGSIEFTDRSIEEGLTYIYRLESATRPEITVETEGIEVPVAHAHLYQNHPNPFNPQTTIPFTVPGSSRSTNDVVLAVYDVSGALVTTLAKGAFPGGRHEVRWDGSNTRGDQVSSGIYFARIDIGGFKAVRKMVLLR
ncbi:MAG: VCBS repeat-containing protein [bacterium]|nr:MAG: VCBS repeat-containing protein [bacterium]